MNFFIKFLLLFLIGLNISYADTWLGIGGVSYHTCQTCNYNGANPGLGIQHDYTDTIRLVGGGYYNSFRKASFYGGAAWQPLQYGMVRVGLVGGVITNYNNLEVPFIAVPVVSIEGKEVGLDVLGFPSVGSKSGLISANFKFKL